MADEDPQLQEEDQVDETEATANLAALRTKRKTLRQQISNTGRRIETVISARGSRGALLGLVSHFENLLLRASLLQTELSPLDQEEEAERQDNLHLTYVTKVGETTEAAKAYLRSREGEAPSEIEQIINLPTGPTATPSEIGRREQEHLEALAAAQKRCDDAREQIDQLWGEADAAQAALRQLTARPADPVRHTPVVPPVNPLAVDWVNQQRRINTDEQEAPDDWIDKYDAGLLPPVSTRYSSRSAVSAELEPYQGKALDWFGWIDLFRALVHDTPKSPGEKLALLKRYLRDECLDVVYGLGGGEAAYMQALVRLKETYGRRDVMKAAHLTALGQLEPKGEGASFKRFAEKVRSHLFDLSRIGETSAADVIEKICLKLNLQDRLAWNENRRGRIEERSMNEFGSWLCSRAAAYQNAYSIAASQMNASSTPANRGFPPKRSRAHHTTAKTQDGGAGTRHSKPYCFKCEKSHWLSDCEEFKALPVGERVHFCMKRRLCFSCFSCKHSVYDCPSRRPCKHTDCRYTHHPLLHDEGKLPVKSAKPSTTRAKEDQRVALGMLRLQIQGSDGSWSWASVFADEGSDTTLMRSAFATSLKIRGSPQILTVDGAGGVVMSYASELIHFHLRTEFGEIVTLEGSTMKKVASPAPITDWSKEKLRWPHLQDLPVGEVGGRVDILIGTDHLHLLNARESREGEDYEPIASRTRLGWIIRGVTNRKGHVSAVRSFIISGQTHLERLTDQMRRFCDTEAFGTEFQQGCLSPDNQRAMTMVKEKTRRLAVGYEVPIIWRDGEPDLVNNRAMAVNRFQSLLRRFEHHPTLERDYTAAMQKTLDQGYASRVTDSADAKYFLAHHGVYKGAKLRVVFDAAASFRGKALNDTIISGPALQPALAAVITRFRQEEFAWASDIEAMFSRFRLSPEDSKFFCFIWRDASGVMSTYKMDRLPFGASCSPFVAIHTIQRIAEDAGANEEITSVIRERMYVDDYLSSSSTIQKGAQEASAVKKMLADADLNLQGWVSNSPEFLRQMVDSAGPRPENIHQLGSNSEEKVLGVFWDTHLDNLGFKVAETPNAPFTKMELASRVAGVFDPLGTASPIIVKAKIRLRKLGQDGLQWTDVVGEEDRSWWLLWFKELRRLNDVAMPRCLFPNRLNLEVSELHTFCDASEEAYAAVIYVRSSFSNGQVVVRQVKATNKLAPKKTISVPKLELNAALLGARITQAMQKALPSHVRRRRFWTDSSTVRNWIRAAASDYQVFVSNRVGELQTITEADEWRFVPGRLNPADAATRSTLDGDIFPNIWWSGPDFLSHPEEDWPADLPWMKIGDEAKSIRVISAAQTIKTDWTNVQILESDVPQLCGLKDKFFNLIQQCQEESFADELRRLRKNKPLHSTSHLLALAPILGDDGLLRLGGRIGRARLPYDQLHPPFLPGRHPLSEKIVRAFHESLKHVGTDFLLSYIRQHFWVTKGRELVKKIRRDCVVCRRNRAQPGEQMMADLIESRLDYGALPFTRTAVDLFGPLEIGMYRNRTAKRWGIIYTCLVTRAVFLELVPSLSSTDFLLSFRKFVSIYRYPEIMHSDNGTNFVGAERELREAAEALYASEEVPKFLHANNVQWTFQPPRTPHFGGAHESLVKSTKKALYNALDQEKGAFRHPTEDVLRTLLYEVAGLLNTRPLTYASSDPADFRPLTPNDFLNRAPTAHPPAGTYGDAQPRDHYRYLQRTLNLFWDLWKTVYLQSLAARKKWKVRRSNFAVGDVVLEVNKGFGRGVWSIGHVVQVFPGSDGCVRAVDIQTETGLFRRGITELCLLETSSSVPASGEDVSAKTH